jgi:hypothetical protein
MGIISTLFGTAGSSVKDSVEAVGNVVDKLFTSDEERLDRQIILERLRQQPALAQAEINKVEAAHPSIFIAGWRAALGWVCVYGFFFHYVVNPIIQWITGRPGIKMDIAEMVEIVVAMLGLVGFRTYEKLKGVNNIH